MWAAYTMNFSSGDKAVCLDLTVEDGAAEISWGAKI